jgi:hypothetical protein
MSTNYLQLAKWDRQTNKGQNQSRGVRLYGIAVMILFLTGMPNQFFAGYSQECDVISHVVLPLSAGATGPMDAGCNL